MHPVYQVGSSLFRRQIGVQIPRSRCALGNRILYGQGKEKHSSSKDKPLHHLRHVSAHVNLGYRADEAG
jgi:hypothetical protein